MKNIYGLQLIRSALNAMYETTSNKQAERIRQICPYVIYDVSKLPNKEKIKGYENNYIPLNRDYKPIGYPWNAWDIAHSIDGWVNYEDYNFLFIPKEYINRGALKDNDRWLWDDSDSPFRSQKNRKRYIEILKVTFFAENLETIEKNIQAIDDVYENIEGTDRPVKFYKDGRLSRK